MAHKGHAANKEDKGLRNKYQEGGWKQAQYVYIIDQARGQDAWILAEFSFCVFMDRDEVEVHKNVKRERGQYPAILTELDSASPYILIG